MPGAANSSAAARKRRPGCGLESPNTLVTLCGEGYEHSVDRVGVSIPWIWNTKRALASVEILSSIVASLFLLAVRGPGAASNLCLDRPGFWQRPILSIQLAPGCHESSSMESDENRASPLPLPPTTATIPNTNGSLPSKSRSRADTRKTHTHVQQVAVG
jgi:hypothetical protein